MTPQEVKLWAKLRELRQLGHHFRRQSPIDAYIVDFECRKAKLIVEVDGGHHGSQPDRDQSRDRRLCGLGYRVLRFWNNQIDRELKAVVESILHTLEEDPTRLATDNVRCEPPSPEWEG